MKKALAPSPAMLAHHARARVHRASMAVITRRTSRSQAALESRRESAVEAPRRSAKRMAASRRPGDARRAIRATIATLAAGQPGRDAARAWPSRRRRAVPSSSPSGRSTRSAR